ncbi:BMA-SRP-2 [Dirofilaria immitis]|nr:BMA-SRP-2 [Dirofilaria immitis]
MKVRKVKPSARLKERFLQNVPSKTFKISRGATFGNWVNIHVDNGIFSDVLMVAEDLVLFNSLYFTDDWQYEFSSLYYMLPFHSTLFQTTNIPMMKRMAEFPQYEDQQVRVISLPLKNSEVQMLIILPKERHGLAKLESELTGQKLFNYLNALNVSGEITVVMPKIGFSIEYPLSNGLKNMGLQSIFDESTGFSGVLNRPLSLNERSRIINNIQINKKGIGSESANISAAVPTVTDEFFLNKQIFGADHPFLYAIIDSREIILYFGRFMA